MKHRQHNLRKAAILVASLDPASADMLLDQMTAEQAALVRQTIAGLSPIDPDEQSEVIEEFFRIGPLVPDKQPTGIELDSRLARRLAMSDRHADRYVSHEHDERPPSPPFRLLHEASVASLVPLLEREHPQTVAVVVSHLPPERAAGVLASLPPALQAEVARRLVDLDQADPEVLRDVERGLESWLSQQVRSDRRRSAGLAALTKILSAADRGVTQDIVANLAVHDRQLAGKLQGFAAAPRKMAPQPLVSMTFADVAELDDHSLGKVLRSAEPDVVVLALAGAASELVERVVRGLPPDEGRSLRFALDHMGPTRLSDVDEAQRQLADIAAQMEETGQLSRRKRGFSLAA